MKSDDLSGTSRGSAEKAAGRPPFPGNLLTVAVDAGHIEALRTWGYRIGLAARDALVSSGHIERAVGDRDLHIAAVSDHFGLSGAHHSLRAEPLRWLRLGETQATRGLQHFLALSDERIRLFLRALVPAIVWPADLEGLTIEAETRAGRGRIDLLISGKSQNRTWGAIVEAKFEHGLKGNPLGAYKRHGTKLKMAMAVDGQGGRTAALIVLGKNYCRQTRRKISKNEHWSFVHWHEVLRRFDASLVETTVDEEFRRFRRTLWERAGITR